MINPLQLLLASLLAVWTVSLSNTQFTTQLKIGMIQPLSVQCVNQQWYTSQVTYVGHFSTFKSAGIGLAGFDGVVQNRVYFKAQIYKLDNNRVQIKTSCQDDTLFYRLKFSYIIVNNFLQYLDVYSECFLCNELSSTTGYRKHEFFIQQHRNVYSTTIQLSSSISALNISNSEENAFNFKINTLMKPNNKTLFHTIQAWAQTIISSICITTIVYDFSLISVGGYRALILFEEKHINFIDKATFMRPSYSQYWSPLSIYYGISGMVLGFKPALTHTMIFSTSNATNLNAGYLGNQNLQDIRFSGFFARWMTCSGAYAFDPKAFTCSATCPSQTSLNTVSRYCEQCHATCSTCQGSGVNKCLTCNNVTIDKHRTLASGSLNACVCLSGYIESLNGSVVCAKCSDLITNCDICSNSTFCTTCTPPYVFSTLTNQCGCINNQYLSNGVCMPYPGCTSIQTALNLLKYCSICDVTKNFQLVTADATCRCMSGYVFYPPLITCVDLCGDGIVIDSYCDDGNLDNGDGCSSICTQQVGFKCFNKSAQQPSLCMPVRQFQLNFQDCQRQITSNTAIFTFKITPPQPLLSQLDLTACMSFTFGYNIVSYTYDQTTGLLSVCAQFKETIEGQNHNFAINMFSENVVTNQLKTSFDVNGLNSWVIMDKYASIYKFMIYVIAMICILAWILALIASLFGFKHLTFELILPMQAIYFVLVSQSSGAPGLRALQLMKFINGYNSVDGLKLKQITSEDDSRYFSQQYLSNFNYFILVDIVCLLLLFLLQGIHLVMTKKLNKVNMQKDMISDEHKIDNKKGKEKQKEKVKEKQRKKSIDQRLECQQQQVNSAYKKFKITKTLLQYIGYRFFTIILLLNIQSSIFYLGISIIYQSQSQIFSIFLNDFASIAAVILGLFALWLYPCQSESQIQINVNKKLKYSYTKLYLIWYVIFVVFLVFVQEFDFKGLILLPILQTSLILPFLIFKNPYKTQHSTSIRIILPLIQQITLVVPIFLLWVSGFLQSYDSLIYFITTMVIASCCFVAIILTPIRLYFQVRYFQVIQTKLNISDEQQNQIDCKEQESAKDSDKKNFQTQIKQNLLSRAEIHQDRINAETNKITKPQQQNYQENSENSNNQEENEEDIQFIKKRLRNQLKSKRNIRSK